MLRNQNTLVVGLLCAIVSACGANTATNSDNSTDVAATDLVSADSIAAADVVDPFLGAPPAICRVPKPWKDQAIFSDVTDEIGIGRKGLAVDGVRLSTADLDGDLFPDLLIRNHKGQSSLRDDWKGPRGFWLLKNGGKAGSWTLTDNTKASGITATRDGKDGRQAHVVVSGDVDNDGDLDVFMGLSAAFTPTSDVSPSDSSELMLNDGKGNFTLTPANVFGSKDLRKTTSGATFLDYNRDGKLDLFVSYTTWINDLPVQNHLLAGDGLGGLSVVTTEEGLLTKPYAKLVDVESGAAHRNTWCATACDMNGDGDPDILTGSYGRYFNGFWLNGSKGDSGKRFDDLKDFSHLDRDDNDDWTSNWNAQCYCKDNPKAEDCDKCPPPVVQCKQLILPAYAGGGYRWNHPTDRKPYRLGGVTGTIMCADLDRDGDLDLVETTIVHPDVGPSADPLRVVRNDGKAVPTFEHIHGDVSGLMHTFPGQFADDVGDMTGAVFDFDNDGRLDILVASSDYPGTHAMIFHQKSDGTYEEVPVDLGISHFHAHGVAVADFDRDGDLDVVIGHSLARCNLAPKECYPTNEVHAFRNDLKDNGNYVELQLVGGAGSNKSAIGARVWLTAGGVTQMADVGGGFGHFGMQNDLVLHFGLGAACSIDEVKVRWPDGTLTTQSFKNVRANYLARLTQGMANPSYPLVK